MEASIAAAMRRNSGRRRGARTKRSSVFEETSNNSPPKPKFYDALPSSPVILSSGIDLNRTSVGTEEFWGRLEGAFEENLVGLGQSRLWEFGGEWRESVGTALWQEREREEEQREERERDEREKR